METSYNFAESNNECNAKEEIEQAEKIQRVCDSTHHLGKCTKIPGHTSSGDFLCTTTRVADIANWCKFPGKEPDYLIWLFEY